MSKDVYTKLTAEFGPEALSKDSSRGFDLTSIKAQYIVERLNEVLGVDGWSATYDFKPQDDKSVVSVCTLTAQIGDKEVTRMAVGGANSKKLIADTFKSAMTDSLGKAASHLGIGNSVFKGLVSASGHASPRPKSTPSSGVKSNTWQTKSANAKRL